MKVIKHLWEDLGEYLADDPFKSVVVEIFAALDSAMVEQGLAVLGRAKTEIFFTDMDQGQFPFRDRPVDT